jgi:multidrug resistance efflux pump
MPPRRNCTSLEALRSTSSRSSCTTIKVVAPRAGIVGDVPVRVGDRVVTTTQLTTVDRPGSLEAYIYVPIEKSAD